MFEGIFKTRPYQSNTAQVSCKPTPKAQAKRSAVVGEDEVYTRMAAPKSELTVQNPQLELVPPTRGQGAGQGCMFTDDWKVCVPCFALKTADDSIRGCVVGCIPFCAST